MTLSDEQLLQHGRIAGLECLLKHVAKRDVEGNITVISRAITGYDSLVRQTLIRYLASQTTADIPAKLVDKEPMLEEDMKTAAQQWMDEGAEKLKPTFIKQGIEKGIEQGIEQVARKLLTKGAEIDFVAETTGLSVAQVEAIKSSRD